MFYIKNQDFKYIYVPFSLHITNLLPCIDILSSKVAISHSFLFRVSFFWPFYADYRVLYIDSDYQYALVGSGSANYLWILSRTPQLTADVKSILLNEATRRGYDVSKFIWIKQ